jgi:hypothetical protein
MIDTPTDLSYGPPSGRIPRDSFVVYTAIAGGYDSLKKPFGKDVNYVAFVDEPVQDNVGWQIRNLRRSSPDPNRCAKLYKVLSHEYFPEAEYSLWIDGTVTLLVSPITIAEMFLGDFDMIVHRHPQRTCAYAEADICRFKRLDDIALINAQMARYRRERFPSNAGLYHNAIILRRHNDRVKAFNDLWWTEVCNGSRRDQLSSVYAARKVGLKVGYFPGTPLRSQEYNRLFSITPHLGRRGWRLSHGKGRVRS